MSEILVLGYGNPDRQDDGVAWHVLDGLAQALGMSRPEEFDEELRPGEKADLLFQLQLTPEIAEVLSSYSFVCFVDAHTGAIQNDLNVEKISALYQTSPFTHHMTPQTCLSIAENLYHRIPEEALLISVRGYAFEFSTELSEKTQSLAKDALRTILEWLDQKRTNLP
jgi:hydrogenase maturation protease